MRAIVTGMNGTVAPALALELEAHGDRVVRWDRTRVPIDDPEAIRAFLEETAPDQFFHVATGSPDWAETVARLCAERGIPFLFTSSVSVFSDRRRGPFGVDTPPDATDDYGRYKIECEERVARVHPTALIARLGWQIGESRDSNTMARYLWQSQERDGRVEASARWIPSCAFLADTAAALRRLAAGGATGLYHLEGNPGMSFFEIATALSRRLQGEWEIVATDTPDWDNRMADPRVAVGSIADRLAV